MFYVYLQNIKSATGLKVTVTVSLSRNISMNVLLKCACETDCHQLSTQTVCMMSNHKSSLKLQRLAFIYIIQQFISLEAILSSKASYWIEMLITDAAARKWQWP